MNRKNVLIAIDVMKKAREANSLDMINWQSYKAHSKKCESVDELHACGNKACFAGHIALCDEFKADGGSVGWAGMPEIRDLTAEYAISDWLGITRKTASMFVYGDRPNMDAGGMCYFYKKAWCDITADDVIEKLNLVLNGELR